MKPVTVLNGPNLNLLGKREPAIYGSETLADIEASLHRQASKSGVPLVFKQSNHEGVLIDLIQEASASASALIINAGAYTHTSIAIHDALRAVSIPIIEVHLSNIFRREPYRHHSYVSSVASGVICGFGAQSYTLAMSAALHLIQTAHVDGGASEGAPSEAETR